MYLLRGEVDCHVTVSRVLFRVSVEAGKLFHAEHFSLSLMLSVHAHAFALVNQSLLSWKIIDWTYLLSCGKCQ